MKKWRAKSEEDISSLEHHLEAKNYDSDLERKNEEIRHKIKGEIEKNINETFQEIKTMQK